MYRTTATLAAVACAALAIGLPEARAQAYPAPGKPIKIVVPTAPAGGNDAMTRILAQKITERTKQPMVVENKPGGNGAIGTETVARSPADGYTILLGYIATHGINPGLSKVPYDPVKDFAPIAQIAVAQNVLVVHPSVPAKNLKELIALAKAKPSSLSYASAGSGTAPHIAGELLKRMAGVDLLHVPYKGSGPALTDTLGGTTQVMFPSLVAAAGHVKSGKLRALAVTGLKRSPLFPDLPTVAESLPGFEVVQWYAFFAPAKTPPAALAWLNTQVVEALKQPDVAGKFADQGAEIVTGSPQDLAKLVDAELAKWSKFIKEARLTAD